MRLVVLALPALACGGATAPAPASPTPAAVAPAAPAPPPAKPWPASRRDDTVDVIHGVSVADPYRWLEDAERREVKDWMAAEDAYARAELARLPRRDALAARLKQVYYFDALSAPQHRKGRYFYTRKHADREKSVVYWRQGEKGAEKVLLDPNGWSTDGSTSLGAWQPSWSGKLVAYKVRQNNSDEAVAHVLDVASGKELADVIPGTKYGGFSWTPDGKGFYYTWVPPVAGEVTVDERPGFAELRFHKIGADPAQDPVVYPATHNAQTFVSGAESLDGHWLFVEVQHGWRSTDVYFRDLRKKGTEWTPLAVGIDANFSADEYRDRFYVMTNDGAPKFRVYRVDPKKPARANWLEIVPETDDTLSNYQIVGGRLVLEYLRNAVADIELHDFDGKLVRKVDLPGLGATSGLLGLPDEDTGYFAYTSFTEPMAIYKTSIATGKTDEWSRVKLPIDTSQLVTEQVWYPSKDGTRVSMFIVHRKDAVKDGKRPVLLTGYGGFAVAETPWFSSAHAVWMENGGVFALPNLRGGSEYGESWHRGGMLGNKQNVFDDFVWAARYLVAEGWTSPQHLGIQGGSNGGLLVGAAMTQAPELFKAVVCEVPLLDMVRYHKFGSGKTWVPEYGTADEAEQFQWLYAYSPYHHVKDGVHYPALLVESADSDDRVDPMHARKFVAAVQNVSSGDTPVWLRIEKHSGHGGADMVKQAVELTADSYAFLLAQLE